MQVQLKQIPLREVLHFLGWRGAKVEGELIAELKLICTDVMTSVQPRAVIRRFALEESGAFAATTFVPGGGDVRTMLHGCQEGVLLAATLGAQSERLLLQAQARDARRALLVDAALSAAIESVCDQMEDELRASCKEEGLYLTDRFSPGYGDMPLAQTREICAVMEADRKIGLTVSRSGIMMPRKSVTAVMGISRMPVTRRPAGCEGCAARETCPLRRK